MPWSCRREAHVTVCTLPSAGARGDEFPVLVQARRRWAIYLHVSAGFLVRACGFLVCGTLVRRLYAWSTCEFS